MKPQILAIIPAREGSKRVMHKNFRPFAGKTLTDLAIQQALKSKLINCICVTSDSEEVHEIAKKYPTVKRIERPKDLSDDYSPAIEYVKHALYILEEEEKFDLVVILQPSSPLREPVDIDNTIELLINNPEADSAVSVVKVDHMVHPLKLKILEGNLLLPFIEEEAGRFAAHEMPNIYARNCAVYCTWRKDLETRDDVIGDSSLGYIMSPSKSVDINEQIDFDFAEYLYQNQFEKQRIMIVGDSLGLPRNEDGENVPYDSTWPYLLNNVSTRYDVINRSIRARNIKHCINDISEINLIKPNVIIFQVGIVDCAPRIFTSREKLLLKYLPQTIRQAIINRRSKRRKQITSKEPLKHVVTKPNLFRDCYIRLIEDILIANPSVKIMIIPILYHHETMENKSPGIANNIVLYNCLINELQLKYNVGIIDVSCIKDKSYYCNDGYHLNKLGNYKLFQAIVPNI